MDINLKDQIIVLDEAHNVEDSAREAASLTLTAVDLQNTLDDLDRLGKENNQVSKLSGSRKCPYTSPRLFKKLKLPAKGFL